MATHKRSREHSAHSSDSNASPPDDTVGHLQCGPGFLIADRYAVMEELGTGTFGKVLLCNDTKHRRKVAVKVVRHIRKYVEAAEVEAEILADVNAADPSGASLIVRFYGAFSFRGHFCMVFETLGPSLYDYVKANEYRPVPLYALQAFADQLLASVAFLHEMQLVHTDLKLENILLCCREPYVKTSKPTSTRATASVLAPRQNVIKLIDFGGATYDYEHKSSIICTRQYRAPEVILGVGWSMPADVWSLGCILMELYTGELLFQTHDSAEHLALVEACVGQLPRSMTTARTPEARRFFDRHGRSTFPLPGVPSDSVRHVRAQRRIQDIVSDRDTVFLDLIQAMLRPDPAARITAKDAFNHRLFTSVRGVKSLPVPARLPRRAPPPQLPPPPLPHQAPPRDPPPYRVPQPAPQWRPLPAGSGSGGGGGAAAAAPPRDHHDRHYEQQPYTRSPHEAAAAAAAAGNAHRLGAGPDHRYDDARRLPPGGGSRGDMVPPGSARRGSDAVTAPAAAVAAAGGSGGAGTKRDRGDRDAPGGYALPHAPPPPLPPDGYGRPGNGRGDPQPARPQTWRHGGAGVGEGGRSGGAHDGGGGGDSGHRSNAEAAAKARGYREPHTMGGGGGAAGLAPPAAAASGARGLHPGERLDAAAPLVPSSPASGAAAVGGRPQLLLQSPVIVYSASRPLPHAQDAER